MNELNFIKYLDGRTLRRYIFALLTILWCVLIFSLSAQSGGKSSETSGGFINMFCEFIVPEFSGFSGTQRAEFVESLQFIVRKCAHFTAYMILSILSLQFFATLRRMKKPLHSMICAWIFSTLYAVTDEIHQLFVEGRSGQLRDVLIDSAGALCGVLISAGVRALYLHFHKIKKSDD